jgi:predicted metal-dependent hydrolase
MDMNTPKQDASGAPDLRLPGNTSPDAWVDPRPPHPIKRNLQFDLPQDRIGDWHADGPCMTHFFNTFSIMAPAVEHLIMTSVSAYQSEIKDPVLRADVITLIAQESIHAREHQRYNSLLENSGFEARQMDQRLRTLISKCLEQKWVSPSFRLAAALMFEHHAAMAAAMTIDNPACLDTPVDAYRTLWLWHAIEEIEHKSVAYDVWRAQIKPGVRRYLLRTGAALLISVPFWAIGFIYLTRLIRSSGNQHRTPRRIWPLLTFLFSAHGLFLGNALDWLRYFKPGFHPWQRNNSPELLAMLGSNPFMGLREHRTPQ